MVYKLELGKNSITQLSNLYDQPWGQKLKSNSENEKLKKMEGCRNLGKSVVNLAYVEVL